jgi:hypothetical protein
LFQSYERTASASSSRASSRLPVSYSAMAVTSLGHGGVTWAAAPFIKAMAWSNRRRSVSRQALGEQVVGVRVVMSIALGRRRAIGERGRQP